MPGDLVLLVKIPPRLLDDLPNDDRQAILAALGKRVLLNEYDSEGRAELQFSDNRGQIHFVYVPPDAIKASEG